MKKRILTLLTCLILILPTVLLCACKDEQTEEQNTNPVASGGILDSLPNADLDGRDFVMLTNTGWLNYEDDYNGDPINDTAYERHSYLNQRYNMNYTVSHHDNTFEVLQNTQMSGDNSFDMMYPHPDYLGRLMTGGLLTDLRTLTAIDFSAEWHNKSQVENYTANGKTYLLASDTTIDTTAFGSIVYNRDRYAALGFTEDLYQTVYAGNWTMEKFSTMVKDASANADGAEATNSYALCFSDKTADTMACAMGSDILRKNEDGQYELGFDNARMTSICNQIYDLIFDTEGVIHELAYNATYSTSTFFTAYKGGSSLFLTLDIGSMYNVLRELEFDIGYLPHPKLDTLQKEYRLFCASGMMAIPTIAKNTQESGIVMEAMAVYSNQYLKPAFINTILLGRLSEAGPDFEMLSYLHSIKYYDMGYAMDLEAIAREIVYVRVIRGQSREIVPALRSNADKLQAVADRANSLK